jgi:hypothetical protein
MLQGYAWERRAEISHDIKFTVLIIPRALMWVNLQSIQAAWKISQALKSGSETKQL